MGKLKKKTTITDIIRTLFVIVVDIWVNFLLLAFFGFNTLLFKSVYIVVGHKYLGFVFSYLGISSHCLIDLRHEPALFGIGIQTGLGLALFKKNKKNLAMKF